MPTTGAKASTSWLRCPTSAEAAAGPATPVCMHAGQCANGLLQPLSHYRPLGRRASLRRLSSGCGDSCPPGCCHDHGYPVCCLVPYNNSASAPNWTSDLAQVVHKLRTSPSDRRIILSAWNPAAMPDMALPPCHMMCQVSHGPWPIRCRPTCRQIRAVFLACMHTACWAPGRCHRTDHASCIIRGACDARITQLWPGRTPRAVLPLAQQSSALRGRDQHALVTTAAAALAAELQP